jgi:hypothetical protein
VVPRKCSPTLPVLGYYHPRTASPGEKPHANAWRLCLLCFPCMSTLGHDLRYASRLVARNPGFTAVVVLSIALGIGRQYAHL